MRGLIVLVLASGTCAAGTPVPYTVLRVSATQSGGAYRTLDLAVAAAARLRRQNPGVPLKIEVGAGDYYIDAPLRIGPDLSGTPAAPTLIVAAAKSEPRLLSGRVLRLMWEPFGKGVFRARVADWPVSRQPFDQLFMDGESEIRARYPNSGYAPDAVSPERIARWRNPAGAVLHALHANGWGGMQLPILGKNVDGTLLLGAAVGNNRPSAPHPDSRYVENVFEELDSPREWYYSGPDATLFYMPPAGVDIHRARFTVSGPARIFDLEGSVQNPLRFVRIEGFELQHTAASFLRNTEPLLRSDWMIAREGAIYLENTEDVTIATNTLSMLGGNGVFVSGYNRHVTIIHNHIHDIGGSAISFTGRPSAVRSPLFQYAQSLNFDALDHVPGPRTQEYPAESSVQDNLIYDIGKVEKQVAGVQISMARDIRVAQNTIYRTPRAGININDGTWGGHLIERNDVSDTVLETGDHGAFNSWGRDRFWHPDRATMEEWSRQHPDLWKLDALEPVTIRGNRFHCSSGWDIDLDDGASGYRIYNNVLLSGGLKMREGFDRAAWNNVMVNNGFHPHWWLEGSGDRFEHNILMAAHQPVLMHQWDAVIDFNLFPDLQSLEQARSLGLDRNSRYGDALFEDPARGDFRVKPMSPAVALGFQGFSTEGVGVNSERLKRLDAQTRARPVNRR